MIFALDIGNTSTAIGKFSREGRLEAILRFSTASVSVDALARELRGLKNASAVFAASVVPERNAFWGEVAQEFLGCSAMFLDSDAPWSFHIDVEAPERVGLDRLVNMEAAFSIGKTAIVIDAGTATKIDLLEQKDGTSFFRGGLIAPGVGIGKNALTQAAAQLPAVDLAGEIPLVGRNTEAAMRSGIMNGFIGMVDALVQRFIVERKLPNYTPVIATGGYSPFLKEHVHKITHFDPNLTLRGIHAIGQKY